MRRVIHSTLRVVTEEWLFIAALCAVITLTVGPSSAEPYRHRPRVLSFRADAVPLNVRAHPIVVNSPEAGVSPVEVCNAGVATLRGGLRWHGSADILPLSLVSRGCYAVEIPDASLDLEVLVDDTAGSSGMAFVTTLSDTDGDGVDDAEDGCPLDPLKVEPGICGCGQSEADADHDCVPDCTDECPENPIQSRPPCDLCPDDPEKIIPGRCGCGYRDSAADLDGDCDVDLDDYGILQAEFTGPGVCAPS